jgi:predicted transcriptional regulator
MAEEETSKDVVEVLGNKYSTEILLATEEPLSAREISEEFDIPIATAYRRIEELTEVGLLEQEGRVLTDEDQRSNIYRRNVSEVVLSFEDDDFSVEERQRPDNTLDDVWRTMSSSI